MNYSFINLAIEVLDNFKKPMCPKEIWDAGLSLNLSQQVGSSGKTPWNSISARIYSDIKRNSNSEFIQISKRPALFGLKKIDYTKEKDNKKPISHNKKYHERDLHNLLTTFVYSNIHFKCYTKTIYHEKSNRSIKGYNKWLHPDLVGIYFPFDEYQNSTLQLSEALKENRYKLFSFEMKIKINFSNLREYYFQALSNSSWAHEGYLVTLNIEDDPILIDEIRRLNNSFGIGLIILNAENIEQSEIMFPAKSNEKLDWDTIDRLAEENKDFEELIRDLLEDIKLRKVKSKYDIIMEPKELNEIIYSKGIL